MNKFFKTAAYILFFIFFLASISLFLFIQTDFWQNRLKNIITKRINKNTHLKISIDSVKGNTLNHIKLHRLKLKDKSNRTLLKIAESEIGYNLFSIFSNPPKINSVYLNKVTIDSLPTTQFKKPQKQVNLSIPDFYAENIQFKGHNSNIQSSLAYGELKIMANTISLKIDSSDFRIQSIGEKFSISSFMGQYSPDSILVQKLTFFNKETKINIQGNYSLTDNFGRFEIEGNNLVLKNRLPKSKALLNKKDHINFEGITTIQNQSIHSDLNFQGILRGKNIVDGQAVLDLSGNKFNMSKFNFRSKQSYFSGHMQGNINNNITGKLSVNNLDLKSWKFTGTPTDLSGDFSLLYQGHRAPAKISISMQESNIDGIQFNQITGDLELDENQFTISDSIKFSTNNSKLSFSGEYNIIPRTINITGHISSSKPELIENYTNLTNLQGEFQGTVKILGQISSPVYQGWLEAKNLSSDLIFLENSQAQFDLKQNNTGLKGEMSLQGNDFTLKSLETNINHFESNISIKENITRVNSLHAHGELFKINASGKITDLNKIQINNFALTTAKDRIQNKNVVKIHRTPQGLNIPQADFSFKQGNFSVSAKFKHRQIQALNLNMDNIDLSPINKILGKVSFSGIVNGKINYTSSENSQINMEIGGKNILFQDMSFPNIQFNSQITQDSILINNTQFKTKNKSLLQVKGYIGCNFPIENDEKFFSKNNAIDLNLDYNNFPASYLNNYLLKKNDFGGNITGTMHFKNTLTQPIADAALKIDSAYFAFMTGDSLNTNLHYENDKLHFTKIELKEGNGFYTGSGFLPLNLNPYQGEVNIPPHDSMDMSFSAISHTLPFVSKPSQFFENITGDFRLSLSLSGTKTNPVRSGDFSINNGTINFALIENSINKINSHGIMRNNVLHFNKFKGKMTKRRNPNFTRAKNKLLTFFTRLFQNKPKPKVKKNISLTDSINFEKFFKPALNLHVLGNNVYFRTLLSEVEGYGDVDLSLKGRDTLDITGDVEVSKMFIRKEFSQPGERQQPNNSSEQTISNKLTQETISEKQSHKQGGTNINIHANIPGNLYLRNDQLDCELSGDVWIIKQGKTPFRLSGNLSILEGSFYYLGYEFTNMRGTIFFDPVEMNPELDIHSQLNLTSSVSSGDINSRDESTIDVHLTGDLERPRFQFESSNYSQNNIINLIQSNQNSENSRFSDNALNIFGQYFERQIERKFTQMSGLDKISFKTGSNILQDKNINNWKITLGQRITPKVFLSYEQGTTYDDKSIQAVEVEYRFNNHQFLEGRINQDGLFDLNYKFRFNY